MKKIFVSLIAILFALNAGAQTYGPSMLAEGDWYKVKIVESGIYQITFSDLLGLGINTSELNPVNIRMFGHGGRMLPKEASAVPSQDLEEIAIYVNNQQSGNFTFVDYILFYGEGTTTLKYNAANQVFRQQINPYADTTVYFLNVGGEVAGKRMDTLNQASNPTTERISAYNEVVFHEQELVNLLGSGREWFGEEFSDNTPQNFQFTLEDMDFVRPAIIDWRVAAKSPEESHFILKLNNIWIDSLTVMPSTPLGDIRTASNSIILPVDNPNFNFQIEYTHPDPESIGWLDYITVNYRKELKMGTQQFAFRDPIVAGAGVVAHYAITNVESSFQRLWDITDHNNVAFINATFIPEAREMVFILPEEQTRTFATGVPTQYFAPVEFAQIPNQDIRGLPAADMLIVTHPSLMTEAQQLADFHESHSGLTVHAIDVIKAYNEFSFGMQDVAAIRNMIRFFYDKAASEGQELKYVLMFGMGSYDYKNRIAPNYNLVPVYQSIQSLDPVGSYSTDDFFVSIEDGKGDWDNHNTPETLDLAIGRLPVKDLDEAKAVVDKIAHYATNPQRFGQWRNLYTVIADGGVMAHFMNQAEAIGEKVEEVNPNFNLHKIYLDQFELQQTPEGPRYPEANEAIKQALNQGSLVLNYCGNSGPEGLAVERVLTADDIEALDNKDNLPLIMLIGSQYVNISDPDVYYQGNDLLLRDQHGAIALIAPNRPVYSNPAIALNLALAGHLHADGQFAAFGKLLMAAKNDQPHPQHRRYILLGDPALKLALPQQQVVIDSIIGIAFDVFADTLAPAQGVTIKGSLVDNDGNTLSGFNGDLHLSLFDRAYTDTTRGNQNDPFPVVRRDDVILNVEASVNNGAFEVQFTLPEDLPREEGLLKVSWYAYSSDTDAAGAEFLLAGGGPFGIGENELSRTLVKLYPTLARDIVFIEFVRQDHGFTELAIMDMTGNLVHTSDISGRNKVQLNVGHLARGAYIVLIRNHEQSVRQKIILN